MRAARDARQHHAHAQAVKISRQAGGKAGRPYRLRAFPHRRHCRALRLSHSDKKHELVFVTPKRVSGYDPVFYYRFVG
jgi:hypothetical protein